MLQVDVCGMMELAKEVDIPFWEFEVATGIRPTIQYPDMSLEELEDYNLRASFQLAKTCESSYAISLKFIDTLAAMATTAESVEEIQTVIRALPYYYIPAGDIVWEKKKAKENPAWLKSHKKLMQVAWAKRNAELELCETKEEVWNLVARRMSADYPIYDTHSERTFLKLIELSDDVDTLKQVRERSLIWHQSRLASVRKIAALTKYVNRGL